MNLSALSPPALEPLTPERARAARPVTVGILVSGRGSNMEALLRAMHTGHLSARCAVVISDNPSAPALDRAAEYGVETLVLERRAYPGRTAHEGAIASALMTRGVELVLLAGYMRLLRGPVLTAYPNRILNIHPSLLPAFPGLHAHRQALEHGVKVAGCTVHFVDAGTDTGPIVLQAAVPVLEEDTEETLAARVLAQEHRLYPAAVQLYAEGRLVLEGRRVRILPPPVRPGALRTEGRA